MNVPAQQIGPDGLVAGQNMYLDGDGLYRARHGYQPMAPTEPGFRIMGGYWFKDVDLAEVYVVVGETQAMALFGDTWTDITGPNPLTGGPDDPVRFAEIYQNNQICVVFTNNKDSPKIWQRTQSTYFDLTPVYADTGTTNALHINANQMTPGPGGIVQLFVRPQFGNTGAATLAMDVPGSATVTKPIEYINNGLPAALPAGFLVAGQTTNLIYDPTLSYFQLSTNIPAPICRDLVVVSNRLVAYNVVALGVHTPMQVEWTTSFDVTVWGQDNYFILTDSNDPGVAIRQFGNQAALLYGEESIWLMRALGFTSDAQAFSFNRVGEYQPGPVSSAAVTVIETVHYFLAVDNRIWRVDAGLTPAPISDAIYPLLLNDLDQFYQSRVHSVYYPQLRQIWFFYPPGLNADPQHAICLRINDLVFESVQTFAEGLSASWWGEQQTGPAWFNSPNPWNTYTPAWNQFPTRKMIHVFLGTADGNVMRFSTESSSDNGMPITYSFTPGLLNLGPLQNLQPDSVEIFALSTGLQEFLTYSLQSLGFPQDPRPQVVFEAPLDTVNVSAYSLASLLPTDKRTFRWLQHTFSGQTVLRAFSFGGGTFFAYEEERGTREGT